VLTQHRDLGLGLVADLEVAAVGDLELRVLVVEMQVSVPGDVSDLALLRTR
jgi:hypothetical protein